MTVSKGSYGIVVRERGYGIRSPAFESWTQSASAVSVGELLYFFVPHFHIHEWEVTVPTLLGCWENHELIHIRQLAFGNERPSNVS